MHTYVANVPVHGDQLQQLIDSYTEFCEYSDFDGNMSRVSIYQLYFYLFCFSKQSLLIIID